MPSELTSEGVRKVTDLARKATQAIHAAERKIPTAERQELPEKPASTTAISEAEETSVSTETITRNIEKLNARVQNIQRDLQFSVDAETGRTVIRVIDSETRETIRVIPPEDILAIEQRLNGSSGLLINSSV